MAVKQPPMTLDEGLRAFQDRQTAAGEESAKSASLVTFKPMLSRGLAVHPSQVAEAEEFCKKRGVPTEYHPDGRPLVVSSRHFRRLAAIQGLRHQGY